MVKIEVWSWNFDFPYLGELYEHLENLGTNIKIRESPAGDIWYEAETNQNNLKELRGLAEVLGGLIKIRKEAD